MTKYILLLSILLSASSFAATNKVRIISVTDLHGALESNFSLTKDGKKLTLGGAPLIASYVKTLKEQTDAPTLIVDAGDLFQGTLISNTVEGKSVIDFYNHIGVTAAAIGNHEFDYGPVGPNTTPKTPNDDPRGALKARMAQANFPFLAANIRDTKGERPDWAKGSILIEKQGVKVGIIGIATPETATTTIRANILDLNFIDPVEPIINEAEKLKSDGAQVLVLTIHAGGGCSNNKEDAHNDLSSCETSEIFNLIKRLPEKIVHLIVAGHTHKGMAKVVSGIPVLQSFSNGKYVSWADITLSNGDVETKLSTLVPICGHVVNASGVKTCESFLVGKVSGETPVQATFLGKEMKPDEEVLALLKPDMDRVEKIKQEPLNKTADDNITRSYYDENALGNFLTDTLRATQKRVDLVMLNNGGLRDNLLAGPINFGAIYTILPFDNQQAIVHLDGATLIKALEIGISRKSGGYSWSGIRFSADACKVQEATLSDETKTMIEPMRIYSLLTVDFIATGGSGFASLGIPLNQIEVLENEVNMRDAVVDSIKQFNGPIQSSSFFDKNNPRQAIKTICQ